MQTAVTAVIICIVFRGVWFLAYPPGLAALVSAADSERLHHTRTERAFKPSSMPYTLDLDEWHFFEGLYVLPEP